MGARIYNPRFEASEVSHVSTHLLKLTLTRPVEQDKRYQLGSATASERIAFEAVARYIPAIDSELRIREIARA